MWWDWLSQNVQWFHSHAVGHRRKCDKSAIQKICNVTHSLLVIGNIWWDYLSPNVQCYSLPVGHSKRCIEIAIHNVQVTHKLLVMAKMWWDCLSQNVQGTHKLLVIGKVWWDCLSQNVQYHSQANGHRKRCDDNAFHIGMCTGCRTCEGSRVRVTVGTGSGHRSVTRVPVVNPLPKASARHCRTALMTLLLLCKICKNAYVPTAPGSTRTRLLVMLPSTTRCRPELV